LAVVAPKSFRYQLIISRSASMAVEIAIMIAYPPTPCIDIVTACRHLGSDRLRQL